MKPKTLISLLVVLPSSFLFGDLFTLNDGRVLKANVLEKNSEEYVLEVFVTKSIKEQQVIKRSDIKSIERVSESDTDYKKIANFTPTPAFLSIEEYDERLKQVRLFLSKHRLSSSASKAKAILKELENELEVITEGGVKSESGLLTKEQFAADEINLASAMKFTQFKRLTAARSFRSALQAYEDLERFYFATRSHREAINLADRLLISYQRTLETSLTGFEQKKNRRMKTLESLSPVEQARAKLVEEQRMKGIKQLREAEQESGTRWPAVDLLDSRSIEDALEQIENEKNRLVQIKTEVEELGDIGQFYKDAWMAAGEQDREKLEPLLNELENAQIEERLLDALVDRFDPPSDDEGDNTEATSNETAEEIQ